MKYIGDWVYDDEPTVIRTAKGPLVTLPYTVELNDIPMMIVQHHESDHTAQARASTASTGCMQESEERAEDHGDRDPPLHQRPAVPHQVSRGRSTTTSTSTTACCTGTASRSSTGTAARTAAAGSTRERPCPARAAAIAVTELPVVGRRCLSRSPHLLRRPQLCRPYPRDEGERRRARSAVLLPEAARRHRAGRAQPCPTRRSPQIFSSRWSW